MFAFRTDRERTTGNSSIIVGPSPDRPFPARFRPLFPLGALPVADPGKLHLLQPPNPFCREPPTVVTDALIVHPHPQAVESALIGRHTPVAVLLMERMQFGQPPQPHSFVPGLTDPLRIPDKTEFIEQAHLLIAQTACPIEPAHFHDPPAQIDVLRPFRRHVAMPETAAEFPQAQKA